MTTYLPVVSSDVQEPKLFSLVNETLAALVMGEINQLHNQGDLNISIQDYEQTIYCKTGALFELTTSGIAVLEKAPENIVNALKEYGKQLGIAFQVADDMLDYSSSTQTLGKSIGEDLEDGRITLPLILALKNTSDKRALEKANSCLCPVDRLLPRSLSLVSYFSGRASMNGFAYAASAALSISSGVALSLANFKLSITVPEKMKVS